jgi:hypothetical protein
MLPVWRAGLALMLLALAACDGASKPTADQRDQVTGSTHRATPLADASVPWQQLEFETTPCFGECAVFRVVITANGQLNYTGVSNVYALGDRKRLLDASALQAINTAITQANWASLKPNYNVDECPNMEFDQGEHRFRLVDAQGSKAVVRNQGCIDAQDRPYPIQLADLASTIYRAGELATWLSAPTATP